MNHIVARQKTGYEANTTFYLSEDLEFHSLGMVAVIDTMLAVFNTKADAMLVMAGLDLDSDAFTFTIEEV